MVEVQFVERLIHVCHCAGVHRWAILCPCFCRFDKLFEVIERVTHVLYGPELVGVSNVVGSVRLMSCDRPICICHQGSVYRFALA